MKEKIKSCQEEYIVIFIKMGICYTNSTFVSLSATAIFLKVLIFSKSDY
jgi:hypothetical protein